MSRAALVDLLRAVHVCVLALILFFFPSAGLWLHVLSLWVLIQEHIPLLLLLFKKRLYCPSAEPLLQGWG